MKLFDYQQEGSDAIDAAWKHVNNVLYVLPCRGGKTVIFTHKIKQNKTGGTVAIAHRQELVIQMSMTLARNGVYHRIVGAKTTQVECNKLHYETFGKSFVDPTSRVVAASVDTLIKLPDDDPLFHQTSLIVNDEAHHVLKANKWGKCVAKFKHAKLLGVTATPCRADKKGLGAHNDGVFEVMVEGPTMAELLRRGRLAPYRIFVPKTDLDLTDVHIGSGGEYVQSEVTAAVGKSRITGDAVAIYQRITPEGLGLTFCVSVDEAEKQAAAFRAAGVSSESVSSDTDPTVRATIMRKHAARDILMLCNVGLIGEGVDIPNLEVVIFCAPTASYGWFVQMFCRALNPAPGKIAYIFDLVGNIMKSDGTANHGVPDSPQKWTLDRPIKGMKQASILRSCLSCLAAYERILGPVCPYCEADNRSYAVGSSARRTIEQVDGDVSELDLYTLNRIRGLIDAPPTYPWNPKPVVMNTIDKRHAEKVAAQAILREEMAWWAAGKTDIKRAQREFYITFEVDILTAQTLNAKDANELFNRIRSNRENSGAFIQQGVEVVSEQRGSRAA